jgi:hypothetical protein
MLRHYGWKRETVTENKTKKRPKKKHLIMEGFFIPSNFSTEWSSRLMISYIPWVMEGKHGRERGWAYNIASHRIMGSIASMACRWVDIKEQNMKVVPGSHPIQAVSPRTAHSTSWVIMPRSILNGLERALLWAVIGVCLERLRTIGSLHGKTGPEFSAWTIGTSHALLSRQGEGYYMGNA